jgi:hypothetical protein
MVKILKVRYREFRCDNCGHVQQVQTNHEDKCFDYCKNCSWKPSWGKSEHKMMFNGQTYRLFMFAGRSEVDGICDEARSGEEVRAELHTGRDGCSD